MLSQLQQHYGDLLAQSPALQARLSTVLQQLEQQAQQQLAQDSPFAALQVPLQQAEAELAQQQASKPQIQRDWQHYHLFLCQRQLPTNQHFWQQQLALLSTKASANLVLRRLMLQQWRQQFEQSQAQWQLQQLTLIRQQQWLQLQQWLDLLASLSRDFHALGLEPGDLIDFSSGDLQASDVGKLQQWAHYLQQQPQLLQLCIEIGKQRKPAFSEQIEMIAVPQSSWVNTPHAPAKEEVFGLTLGQEIAHALPCELALLGEPQLAELFDLKYAEQQLLSYQLRGWQPEWQTKMVLQPHSITVEQNMGPMILCVDTSLSMRGTPELIAKAVTLYLAATANAQQRDCYLINFATDIDTLKLDDKNGLAGLLAFLGQSFCGGTDVEPALNHGLTLMTQGEFQQADLVILSDFVMTELSEANAQRMAQQRQCGNRCYGLAIAAISDTLPSNLHLDKQWYYDADNGSIECCEQEALPLDEIPPALMGSA
ncbi:VWA domain-containing protein [uncultured Ferrimonas sp.]|uniref:VWA domain-containing protein n=1 Tax=uncultured Ferrimonas sp. TaxID=432640 RepID=UPI00260E5AAC|nr:VWA domain-containing protein [uncultured Ferrimonas sp.]